MAPYTDGMVQIRAKRRTPTQARPCARLETDLALMLQDRAIARLLRAANLPVPALAQNAAIQRRSSLVDAKPQQRPTRPPLPFSARDGQRTGLLDRLSAAQRAPTPEILLETFAEDPCNFSALQARLKQFLTVTEIGDVWRHHLAQMPILPVEGQPRAPSELAFRGNQGNHWGTWKIRILAPVCRRTTSAVICAAGVTSALPSAQTSRAFFEWLSSQSPAVLEHHIPCVLRHILHRHGPTHWTPGSYERALHSSAWP